MFNRVPSQDFASLTESLNFRNGFDTAVPLISAHLAEVEARLADFLARESRVTPELREALALLPAENLARLVTSPYLCELLMILHERAGRDLEPVKDQVVQALVAEVRLLRPDFPHALAAPWTIDGDFVLDPEIAARFPAVRTACGIRLNYQSYVHNTGREGIGGYDHATALRHRERLETGKAIVAAASPSALSLVDTFTTTIQVRLNKARPNIVNSSTHTSIGLIRCDNFHQLHDDMPEIVDMLVHESIHQYLHLFEEQLFPFVDLARVPASALDVRLHPSAWSGNPLDLRSYTHAILVWYGLWHFWRQFLDAGFAHPEVSRAQAAEKVAEAAFGFANTRSVLDNLGNARAYLRPEFTARVEALQAEVRAFTPAARAV